MGGETASLRMSFSFVIQSSMASLKTINMSPTKKDSTDYIYVFVDTHMHTHMSPHICNNNNERKKGYQLESSEDMDWLERGKEGW